MAGESAIDNMEFMEPPSVSKSKESKAKKESKPKPTPKGKLTITQIEAQLKATITLIGTGLMGFDKFDGGIIVDNADEMATALTDLAKQNPVFKARLQSLLEVGAWAGLLGVGLGQIVLPIAVHHSLIPEPFNTLLAESGDIPVKGKEGA